MNRKEVEGGGGYCHIWAIGMCAVKGNGFQSVCSTGKLPPFVFVYVDVRSCLLRKRHMSSS